MLFPLGLLILDRALLLLLCHRHSHCQTILAPNKLFPNAHNKFLLISDKDTKAKITFSQDSSFAPDVSEEQEIVFRKSKFNVVLVDPMHNHFRDQTKLLSGISI